MTNPSDAPPRDDALDETSAEAAGEEKPSRFADLEALQQEVDRRLRDNQRFLDCFLDEDFVDEDELIEDEADDDFEEL